MLEFNEFLPIKKDSKTNLKQKEGVRKGEKEEEKLSEMSFTDLWAFKDEGDDGKASSKGTRAEHGIHERSTSISIGSLSVTEGEATTDTNAAVKLSSRELTRNLEEEFIKTVHEEFQGTDFLSDMKDLRPLGERIPDLSVMPAYKPLSSLTQQGDSEALLDAFRLLIYCHAMLWSIDVEQRDMNYGNFMVDPETGTNGTPKLCDFDLPHFRDRPLPSSYSTTGTWPFTATELSTEVARLGAIRRVYRHDVESFVTILVWTVLRCRNGVLVDDSPTKNWTDSMFVKCKAARETTLTRIMDGSLSKPAWVSDKFWKVVREAVAFMDGVVGMAQALRARKGKAEARGDEALLATADEELRRLDSMEFAHELSAWLLFENPRGVELADLLEVHIAGPESAAT